MTVAAGAKVYLAMSGSSDGKELQFITQTDVVNKTAGENLDDGWSLRNRLQRCDGGN